MNLITLTQKADKLMRDNQPKKKLNVIKYRDNDHPGMRINWTKLMGAAILVLAVQLLGQIHLSFGAICGIIVVAVVAFFLTLALKAKKKSTRIVGTVITALAGVFVLSVFAAFGMNFGSLLTAVVALAMFFGSIMMIGLTSWWPHGRDSRNRDESK